MKAASVTEAARELEIFLDGLGCLAATKRHGPGRYLLDFRYDHQDASANDVEVGRKAREL